MSVRFRVDLLHPGADLRHGGVAPSSAEWLTGPDGARRLALFSAIGVGVLLVILVAAILPPYWRLSSDLNTVPALQRDVAARDRDLALLRSNLDALGEEARHQIRWADLLGALSKQMPATVKLRVLASVRSAPARGQQQSGSRAVVEHTLRLDAVTPLRPGSSPLLEFAQFMGGIMRDPAVNKRFELSTWDVKPGPDTGPGGTGRLLSVTIVLAERGK